MKINENPLFGILIELDSIERRIKKVKDRLAKIIIAQSRAAKNDNHTENKNSEQKSKGDAT